MQASATGEQRHRKPTKGEQARARLKAAAAELLESTGYHDLKVTDITRAAAAATGSFYRYFPDLRTLAVEVLGEFMERTAVRSAVQGGASPRDWFDGIRRYQRAAIDNYSNHPGLVRSMFQLADQYPPFREQMRLFYRDQLLLFAHRVPQLFPAAALGESEALLLCYALGGQSEAVLREYFVNRNLAVTAVAMANHELAEWLSVLFYRGLFAAAPAAEWLDYPGHWRGLDHMSVDQG